MSIATVLVSGQLYNPDGTRAANTPVRFTLSGLGVIGLSLLVPRFAAGVSDADGGLSMPVVPSPPGTYYDVRADSNGALLFKFRAVVPASDCQLSQIMQALPYPAIDASQQALIDLQAAQAEIEADRLSASGSAAAALQSELDAAGSEVSAAGAALQAGLDRIATGQDQVATSGDRVQTGMDRTAAAADRLATGQDRTATGLDKAAAAADRVQTGLDRVATAADRVQTNLDKVAAAADRVVTGQDRGVTTADRTQTGLDRVATTADRIATAADHAATGLDRVATAADRVQAGLDRTATSADRVQTNLDRVATAADRVQTGLDNVATAADRVQTGQDKTATSGDRVQTGLDKSASAADRVQTGQDRAAASTKAGEAAGSAAQALAIFGTTATMQAKLDTAAAQAQLAQTAAASAASVLQQDLSAISAALHRSPNAITAMCIYDLSKDPDGGAWADRMGHTSWMNESLCGAWRGPLASEAAARAITGAATADYYQLTTDGKFYKLNAGAGVTEVFRGNKAKCSRLPLPIAEGGSVSVFDGTEPGRPMWGRWAFAVGTFGTITSVAAINGKVLVGTSLGLITLDLAKDEGRFQQSANDRTFRLTDRASGSQVLVARPVQVFIVNNAVNAVAACVLPDSIFDVVTGLQIPTIAVATAGGVSVIKHDGTVVNITGQTVAPSKVFFTKDFRIGTTAGYQDFLAYYTIPATSIASSAYSEDYGPIGSALPFGLPLWLLSAGTEGAVSGGSSLTFLKRNRGTKAKGIRAIVTDKYSTGHMLGDFKRAYLCNTEVESVSAPELVVNGDSEAAAFIPVTTQRGTVTQSTDRAYSGTYSAKYTCTDASSGDHLQSIYTVPAGKAVSIDLWAYNPTGNFSGLSLVDVDDGSWTSTANTVKDAWVNIKGTRGSKNTAWRVAVGMLGAVSGLNMMFYFDNISIKEVIPDRSYKAAGANIFGTLVKTPVAVSAQLVGYSGFSALNYIQEPPSTDLDFGTSEWQFGDWFSAPAVMPVGSFPILTANLWDDAAAILYGASSRVSPNVYRIYSPDTAVSQVSGPVLASGKYYLVSFNVDSVTLGNITTDSVGGGVYNTVGTKVFVAVGTGGTLNIKRTGVADIQVSGISAREVGPSIIAERSAATGPGIKLGMDAAGKLVATAFDGTTTRTVVTDAAYNTGVYMLGEACYKAGKLWIELGGNEVKSVTGTPLLTMNNALAVLTIGNSRTLDAPWPGSLAPLKIGATVPTPEQSIWKHSQEKQMFREGAQITLPAATAVVDLHYDEQLDKWVITQATHKSSFTGLIRTAVATPSAGSFSRVAASGGVELTARTTASPGVDVFVPAYGLREELIRRAEAAAKASKTLTVFDFDAIAAQTEFALPVGWTATEVLSAGASQREGATKAWQRLYDGFRETIKFAVAPGAAVWVQITARKE